MIAVIAPGRKIRRNERVVARALGQGEGGVLLHLESGQYHGLNHTGWMAWEVLDGEKTCAEVVSQLRRSLRDAPARLEADIAELMEGLLARKLIELVGD